MRIACIDIGTVSVRMLVSDVEGTTTLRSIKQSRLCNLGEGLTKTGKLSSAAIERVCTAVAEFIELARAAGATHVTSTLTSAARDAQNTAELLTRLEALGAAPQVIPGEVEAKLTFCGVAHDFCGQQILVADNGGGSTELALGTLDATGALNVDWAESAQVGCRRVTELFLPSDPSTASEIAQAHDFCVRTFLDQPHNPSDAQPAWVVATGGTATSLVAIEQALDPYDASRVHLSHLSSQVVDKSLSMLASLTTEERRCVVGLQPRRAPLIVAGTIILRSLLDVCGAQEFVVSEKSLLAGLTQVTSATLSGSPKPFGWEPTIAPIV